MPRNGFFTSEIDAWETPASFMDVLRDEYGTFDLDPCCFPSSAQAPRYFTPEVDGLTQEWTGMVYMNPPYGRGIGAWLTKARVSAENGATVVCLVPARVDTGWWHDEVQAHATEIRFVRGRLHFGGGHERTAHNAPFPSAVVVFGRLDREPRSSALPRALVERIRDGEA